MLNHSKNKILKTFLIHTLVNIVIRTGTYNWTFSVVHNLFIEENTLSTNVFVPGKHKIYSTKIQVIMFKILSVKVFEYLQIFALFHAVTICDV